MVEFRKRESASNRISLSSCYFFAVFRFLHFIAFGVSIKDYVAS